MPDARIAALAAPTPEPVIHDPGLSPISLLNVVLLFRRSIVLVTVGFFATAILLSLVSERTYTAQVAFLVQSGEPSLARLGGVAAQLGMAVPQRSTETPQLYAELLKSRPLLKQLGETPFRVFQDGMALTATLPEIHEIEGEPPAKVTEFLASMMGVSVNYETGVVRVTVTTGDPQLSEQVAARVLQLLTNYNVSTRQSRASAERRFTEERLREASGELRVVEDKAQRFLEANRAFDAVPRLRLEFERLQREILSRQAVVATLQQSYEQAKLDEVRDIPVLTIVDGGTGSAVRDSRGTFRRAAMAGLLGFMLAMSAAFVRNYMRRSAESQVPEMVEYQRIRATMGFFPRRRKS